MPQVRLIDDDGSQIGIKGRDEALEYAWAKNLDLVEVAPDARPPVCRVMDYSKYKYEQEQKAKLARKHQSTITIKEIKLRPKVGDHDYETKKGHVIRFLKNRDKVKVTIMFRGREMTHPERGRALLMRLADGRQGPRRDRVGAAAGRPQHGDDAGAGQAGASRRMPPTPAAAERDDGDERRPRGWPRDAPTRSRRPRHRPRLPPSRGAGRGARAGRAAPPRTNQHPNDLSVASRPRAAQGSEDDHAKDEGRTRSAKKRFKVTAGGKIKRRQAMESHNRGKMSAKRRRKLTQDQPLADADRREALRLLGLK